MASKSAVNIKTAPTANLDSQSDSDQPASHEVKLRPSELARLPASERDLLYVIAARTAAKYYTSDPELTVFNELDPGPFFGEAE